MKACEHLEDILEYERLILKNKGDKEAYIAKYGASMRTLYCNYICPYRSDCESAKEYIPKE